MGQPEEMMETLVPPTVGNAESIVDQYQGWLFDYGVSIAMWYKEIMYQKRRQLCMGYQSIGNAEYVEVMNLRRPNR
jgi:uncharacterized protein with NRDE domain